MELAFAERELRALCLNEFRAVQELGPRVAEKLKRRLADLAAAPTVSDLFGLPGNPRPNPDFPKQIVLNLIDGWQMHFESGHLKKRMFDTSEVDWAQTRRIKILRLENSND